MIKFLSYTSRYITLILLRSLQSSLPINDTYVLDDLVPCEVSQTTLSPNVVHVFKVQMTNNIFYRNIQNKTNNYS